MGFERSASPGADAHCAGIHGHVKVAPDGTVYVPNKGCQLDVPVLGAGHPGLLVSEDAGNVWTENQVSDQPSGYISNSKFSDRHLVLKTTISASSFTGTSGWYKIKYASGGMVTDRTTWSVSIIGNPVHLIQ